MAIARQEKDPDTDIKAVPGSSFETGIGKQLSPFVGTLLTPKVAFHKVSYGITLFLFELSFVFGKSISSIREISGV
ncbi:hypothetical protein [Ruminococcus albus]|uniref:hypothetical protein n=1 Tax=Ruminococcus albus TaxID=1264 RepID=UPI001A9A634B|nr:hypothetical protein [Ruminococcus albus]